MTKPLVMDVLTPRLTWADIEREREIAGYMAMFVCGTTIEQRTRGWERAKALIAERTPPAIEAMERAKGLR